MPQLPTFIGDDPYAFHTCRPVAPYLPKQSRWRHLSLNKLGKWLKKDVGDLHLDPPDHQQCPKKPDNAPNLSNETAISKKAVHGLPGPRTSGRRLSEQRDKLCPDDACEHDQRAVSVDRRRGIRKQGVSFSGLTPKSSNSTLETTNGERDEAETPSGKDEQNPRSQYGVDSVDSCNSEPEWEAPPIIPTPLSTTGPLTEHDNLSEADDEQKLREELEARWILNLSMHFRDRSEREKFFVTYAEEPNRWRRVTVSCDYRNVPPDSLEQDLKTLHYQRDKNARIYEAIRDSLPAIQFYDTVTNLKLQTTDRQLHVHVTEDVNEIISYPPVTAVAHIQCKVYPESVLAFESHLSGFVYKVRFDGASYIKKEIPGPDNVDEFLYELNALYDLRNSKGVIPFIGVVVDDRHRFVKGLLISFASQGALVDIIYDEPELPWTCRERWARQIVHGLSEIHEGGFVQGDFTLSNIVVDAKNDAKLIDINRRGCPVGWEPPEMMAMINSGQRISMYIGVKSDVFQLGMVLWALAIMKDEPERQERPILNLQCWCDADLPSYYRDMVKTCLSDTPQSRLSAKELLRFFPSAENGDFQPHIDRPVRIGHRADTEYIDPADEVSRDDIERYQQRQNAAERSHVSTDGTTYVEALSSPRDVFDSSGSYIVGQRRRSPIGTPRSGLIRRHSFESLRGGEAVPHGPSAPSLHDGQWEHLDAETFLPSNSNSFVDFATHGVQGLRASMGRPMVLGRVTNHTGLSMPLDSTGSSYDIPSCPSYPASEFGRSIPATGALPNPGSISTFGALPHQDSGFDEPLAHMVSAEEPESIPDAALPVEDQSTTNPESRQDTENTSIRSPLSEPSPEDDRRLAQQNLLSWAQRYVQRGCKTIKELEDEEQRRADTGNKEAAAAISSSISDIIAPPSEASPRSDSCPSCNRSCTHTDFTSSSSHH